MREFIDSREAFDSDDYGYYVNTMEQLHDDEQADWDEYALYLAESGDFDNWTEAMENSNELRGI